MQTSGPEGARLNVFTLDGKPKSTAEHAVVLPCPDSTPCDGGYCCGCEACIAERARRVNAGVRRLRQPHEVRIRPGSLAA